MAQDRWKVMRMERKDMMRVEALQPTDKADPIRACVDVDAAAIDAMLNRLTILRSQILPPLPARAKRN